MTRRRLLIAGWLLVLALSATIPLSAVFHGIIHLGPRPLHAQTVLREPVISIGGDVVADHGARSIVVVLFGNLHVSGDVADDLVTFDGRAYLAPHSHLRSDVLSVLGGIYRAPHVTVDGRLGGALYRWDGRSSMQRRNVGAAVQRTMRLGLAAGLALLLIGTCMIIVFPWQIVLIATTLRAAPLKSMVAGLLNLLIFVFMVVPLGLSLAGLPFALLLSGAAILAWLFGVTASAVILGRFLARGTASLLWATAAGLAIIALSMAVPLVGPLAITVIGLTGAGALAVALINRAYPIAPMS